MTKNAVLQGFIPVVKCGLIRLNFVFDVGQNSHKRETGRLFLVFGLENLDGTHNAFYVM